LIFDLAIYGFSNLFFIFAKKLMSIEEQVAFKNFVLRIQHRNSLSYDEKHHLASTLDDWPVSEFIDCGIPCKKILDASTYLYSDFRVHRHTKYPQMHLVFLTCLMKEVRKEIDYSDFNDKPIYSVSEDYHKWDFRFSIHPRPSKNNKVFAAILHLHPKLPKSLIIRCASSKEATSVEDNDGSAITKINRKSLIHEIKMQDLDAETLISETITGIKLLDSIFNKYYLN